MSVFELAGLAERSRIRLPLPTRTWIGEALGGGVRSLPLTADIALDAAQLRFAADPFDRVIYATARSCGARLVTRDERLREFDAAITLW